MDLRVITDKQKSQYNKLVNHVIQSWEWGEFRKSLGIPVFRYGLYQKSNLIKAFQLTLHKIPFTQKYAGYLPKGPAPNSQLTEALKKIGKDNCCAFIKIEPDVEQTSDFRLQTSDGLIKSPKPLFTKYNFILDLSRTEAELLKNMHPKTRYNIKVAQRHGVKVEERTNDQAFKIYLKLYFETIKRQGYYGHNQNYHTKVWEVLKNAGMARILIAYYQKQPLTCWMLLNFKDTLYYPYGGSSKLHPEVMANNLIAWEAIKLGKRLKLKKFDLWGALGPNANPKDPWYGFHRFKKGYGGDLVEFIGTYDLVFDWPIYILFTVIDRFTPLKIFLLKWISH